jgi:hypothetical protein
VRWFPSRPAHYRGFVNSCASSEFDREGTGVFAYNVIRRGERYGLRIIGSLKSKPALNVLAAFEK